MNSLKLYKVFQMSILALGCLSLNARAEEPAAENTAASAEVATDEKMVSPPVETVEVSPTPEISQPTVNPDEAGVDRSPAAASSKKSNKKQVLISGEGPQSSGAAADSQSGWIIKRTKDGKLIKIPKKQTFKFGGSEVSGEANRPSETLLGARTAPREATLIPERHSYRKEFLGTVGFDERTRK